MRDGRQVTTVVLTPAGREALCGHVAELQRMARIVGSDRRAATRSRQLTPVTRTPEPPMPPTRGPLRLECGQPHCPAGAAPLHRCHGSIGGSATGMADRAGPSGCATTVSPTAVAIAATPSPRPVRPSPSVVVPLTDTGAPTASESAACASARRRADLRPVADDLDRDVADLEAGLAHQPGRLGEQGRPRRPGQLGPGGAEVRPEVTDAGRREERVAGGVGGDVGVGVAVEAALAGPEQPGDPQLAP